MTEEPWKGGFDKASWLGRYAEYMISAGMEHAEAHEWAATAWEASDEDCDPEETASADLAYSAEDAARRFWQASSKYSPSAPNAGPERQIPSLKRLWSFVAR